jgi:hypothetical protein
VLATVNQANFTENYSVLHDMTTPALQARVSAAQFGRAFADLRKQNLDLSPALVLSPQFTAPPSLTPQGVLKLTGSFPSRPLQIDFAIDFRPVDGFWLIDTLSVSAVPAGASAPVAHLVAPPAPTASAQPIQQATTPARPAFWNARFSRATHFGPGYRFAANPP